MVTFPYSETVTRIRPAAADRFGDPTGAPAEVDIAGVVVWPLGSSGQASSSESQNRSDEITTGKALLAPPGTDLQPTDQVRYRGDLHDIEPADDATRDQIITELAEAGIPVDQS